MFVLFLVLCTYFMCQWKYIHVIIIMTYSTDICDPLLLQLLKANYLCDERYGQLEREFDEYQKGAADAQRKASDYIFNLKAKVELLQKELNEVKAQQRSTGEGV